MRTVEVVMLIALCAGPQPAVAAAEHARPRGLSDRELAIQRWFSHLTFRSDRSATPWPEWFDDGFNEPGQFVLRLAVRVSIVGRWITED